ncbi:unnamed protein product, partial [Rotaria sp. Silwood2]
VKHAINEGLIHQVHIKKKSEILNMKTTQYSAQVSNVETLSAWKSESGSSCNTSSQLEQKQFGEVVNRLNDVLDITCRTECKIDKQVTRTDQLKIKISIIKQGLTDLTKTMKSTITALLDKKNKQQLNKLC